MVLSKKDIEQYCEKDNLIKDYQKQNIQTCSYDLRMGSQYYFHRKEDGHTVHVSSLDKGKAFEIPPNAICYVISEEEVNMPLDLTASISLCFGLIKSGVMLAAQPPYDPGYSGKTVALLHNLSNEPVVIKRGDHILNIVFTKLSSTLDNDERYSGKYQNLSNLDDYCKKVRVGAVFELKQELDKQRKHFNNFLPNVLTAITVIIAVLTILFTLLIGIPSILALQSPSDGFNGEDKNVLYPEFSVDEEKDVLTICIDGQSYEIALKEQVSQIDEVDENSED